MNALVLNIDTLSKDFPSQSPNARASVTQDLPGAFREEGGMQKCPMLFT